MIRTFAYLILTSARNQLRARLARLRNPRYAMALVIGITYLWLVYLRPAHGRPSMGELLPGAATELLPLLLLTLVAWAWLSGGDRSALAFTQAEVAMLFTAPVSRRTLVLYKIARTQVKIIITSLVWTLVFRQTGSWPAALLHAVSYWIVLSAVNLNRLGVALVHANGQEHGVRGARRNWMAIAVFVTIVAMIAVSIPPVWSRFSIANGPSAIATALGDAMQRPPARWALLPFRVVLAPMSAPPGLAWLGTLAPALLLLAGLAAWVLGTDAAFEEAAAEASAAHAIRRKRLRSPRGAATPTVRNTMRTIRLAPTGVPAVALLWKNAMWLIRSNAWRGMLIPPVVGLLCVAVLAPRSDPAAFIIAGISSASALILLVVGPMTLRNDLRGELLHLSLLKTLPLRGRDVVLAEVASSALPLAATQYLLLLVALLALAFTGLATLTPAVGLALVVGVVPLLAGLNAAVSTIHNALALLFPGWIRLGINESGGIETIGLGMMNVALSLLMLGLLMLLPMIGAAVGVALLRDRLPLALLSAGLVGGLLLLGECVLCAWALGGTLDRVEPLHVAS